jgi:hypothetical protein
MRRLFVPLVAVALVLLVLNLPAATQQQKTQTWTGWISDSNCAAKGAAADHKDCAIKCVKEKGATWVFVDGKAKTALSIHNQDAVNPDKDLGQEVKVTGHLTEDGSLHVESIAPAA